MGGRRRSRHLSRRPRSNVPTSGTRRKPPGATDTNDAAERHTQHHITKRNVLAKLRVYELAKELGLTNKECIDLCNALGYGVKSHSSSLEPAYADQVRRKAEREGLIRDQQPEDTSKKKSTKKAAAKAPA